MYRKSITHFSQLFCCIVIASIAISFGCGGGSDGGGFTSASYGVYFEEDCPDPDPSSVSFQATSSGGERGTAEIVVTDVSDVYAASLYISFNPDLVYVSCTEGDFLNSDGSETELLVNSSTPGLLIIGISRINVSYGVDAVGSNTLLNLTFTSREETGSSTVCFSNHSLLDSSEPPQEIPNVSWCCGSVSVRRL